MQSPSNSPRRQRPSLTLGLGLLFGTLVFAPAKALADNPIIQTLYTADPAPMVHEGTLYLYTTHDEDVTVNDFFTMNDWRVYSTTDVVNWTDHGSPLHYQDFSWASGSAWAGQVVFRNDKFYFYVPVTRKNGGSVIGVAVSDSPTGPFVDPIGAPLVTSDCGDIDPTVFIDEGGQAYLYWGNPNLCYVKLNDDMTSYKDGVVKVPLNTGSFGVRSNNERPTSYEEGPWFYRREDRYYMVFAAGPISEHIGYSTSDSPTGPWTYGGVVMPTEGGSFTNHPGVVDFGGKSLFFYHNSALPGGGGFKRSVAVEEFTYDGSGKIPQLHMTKEGAAAVAALNPFARVEAETMAWSSGVETEVCNEGGMNLTQLDNGDYIKLKEVAFGEGATALELRVAAANPGAVELHLDALDGTLVGTCTVAATGGAQTWASQSCDISGAEGKHDLFLRFTGGGFKFNWWKFTGPGEGGTETSGEPSETAAVDPSTSNTAASSEDSTVTVEPTTSGTSSSPSTSSSSTSATATPSTTSNPSSSSSSPPASTTPSPSGTTTTATASSAPSSSEPSTLPVATTAPQGTQPDSRACACKVAGESRRSSGASIVFALGVLGMVTARRRAR